MREIDKLEKVNAGIKFKNGLDADPETWILLLPSSIEDCRLAEKVKLMFLSKLNGRAGVVVDGENADNLLVLYSLYAFTDKLVVGSFDLPHGRKLRNLLDCGITIEDEIINDILLGAMDGTEV